MDHELAAIEQYREDIHYDDARLRAEREEASEMRTKFMGTAESVSLESDEDGWELLIELDSGEAVRVNVHGIASSDELEGQLRQALDAINDWKAGA